MVRFGFAENEPHSPPSRERSEREMQKTLLGYAHPSNIILKNNWDWFDTNSSFVDKLKLSQRSCSS
ncbi:MAG: hypothetical protein U5L45_09510 [Saprospiraceae bacterium]|nr:hypothetical protein [Saprospiraceae bacterium]